MKSLIITTVIIASILMIVFLVGKPKYSNIFQTAFVRDSVETKESVNDTIDSLENTIQYNISYNHSETIGFVEGQDSFRIVADTANGHFNIQKKIDLNSWKTIEPVIDMCCQRQVELIDWNEDGFIDMYIHQKWYPEVTLYNPEKKGFTGLFNYNVENGERHSLPDKMKYNTYFIGRDIGTTWSNLYRYKKLDQTIYAKLKVIGETYDDSENKPIKTIIELYSVQGNEDSLIQKWALSDFPAFIGKDGGFDTSEFIKDYWTKNWKRFVRD
jgi:hypothetical protein